MIQIPQILKNVLLSTKLNSIVTLSLLRIMQFETEAMPLVVDGAVSALSQHLRLKNQTSKCFQD